jgi:hypothetical protein
MVFMEDSERASAIARERGIDAGLHLNLTASLTSRRVSVVLTRHQQRLSRYLRWCRWAPVIFHPGLTASFEYSVAAQVEEFHRLYGEGPHRIDGHHHMHLCANILLGRMLPEGTIVRRNFTFGPGEKSWCNRLYRNSVDWLLARRHRLADFFFSLRPLEDRTRLRRIFSLSREFVVEVEAHPVVPDEHRFLAGGEIFRWVPADRIAALRPVVSSTR